MDQLRALEQKKIQLIENRKKTEQERISAWQSMNTKLLSLRTAAGALNETSDFNLFTTSLASNTAMEAKDILSATTSTSASPGTYQIVVQSLAAAQKLSSTSFSSQTSALGFSGDIVVGGRTVKISATDSLAGIRNKINAVNSGTNASKVTASIVNYGSTQGFRLILTSDAEGAPGISLLNGGATDLLGAMGFVDASAKTAKNALTAGHMSDRFTAADQAIGGATLLNLTNPQSGSVTISIGGNAQSVAIDLSTDSLQSIRDAINAAFSGVFGSGPASVISETQNGTTRYRLLIEGAEIVYTDADNILETLGVLKRGGVSDERGMTADVANTAGGLAITATTLISDIDGYNDYVSGDTIALTGTSTSGAAVNSLFTITDATTVQDLLTAIETQYGDVTASVTADGKIRIVNNELGDADLAVQLSPSRASLSFASGGDFGAIGTIRQRQIQAGADAALTIDGVAVTPSSNLVENVITGVTLNLRQAAEDTTITLTVARDYEGVKEKISGFVDAYNEVMDAINAQLTYDEGNKKAGGPLFGDSTLRMVKSNLSRTILTRVSGTNESLSTIGLVGIHLDKRGRLSIDDDDLMEYLKSNFSDIQSLFAASWSSTNSNLTYIGHSAKTQAGTFPVQITGLNPVAGYFAAEGDASGTGEMLTGISGDATGLIVRYSGTATGSVGSLTLTLGVAELLDRTIHRIADSVYGFLPQKLETIQNTIKNFDQDIARMESRLDQKMADLEQRFIAMETALSRMKSQSDWLTGQISSVNRSWR